MTVNESRRDAGGPRGYAADFSQTLGYATAN